MPEENDYLKISSCAFKRLMAQVGQLDDLGIAYRVLGNKGMADKMFNLAAEVEIGAKEMRDAVTMAMNEYCASVSKTSGLMLDAALAMSGTTREDLCSGSQSQQESSP